MGLCSGQRWGIIPLCCQGAPTSKLLCVRERAGLDGKAQLSPVLEFPLKQGLGLGSVLPSLESSPTTAHRQWRPL